MLRTIIAAVLLIAVTAPTANAAWYDQCLLFKDENFEGKMVQLYDGQWVRNFDNFQNFNDDTSSMRVTGSCRLTVYYDKQYKGQSFTIGGESRYSDMGNWDDDVSSAKCICS